MQAWDDFLNQFGYAPNALPATFYDTSLKTDSSYEAGGVGGEKVFASSEIAVGSGNAIGVMSGVDPTYRLWIGNPDPALANFSVDKNGVLRASGAIISGEIDIPDTTTAHSFHVDTSGNMWLGANAASFSTAPFKVDNTGNVTMVSWTLKSPDGNTSIIGVNTGASGASGGIVFPNNSGVYFKDSGANLVGALFINSSNIMQLGNTNGNVRITAGSVNAGIFDTTGNLTVFGTLSAGNGVIIIGNSLFFNTLTMSGADIAMGGNNINNIAQLEFFDARLVSGRTRYAFKDTSGTEQFSITPAGGGNTKISMNGFDLRLTSSKTAIVPTSEGYNALYSAEAPEVWFFDFADDKEHIDPLFLEVTEGDMKTIKTEEGEILVFRRRKGHAHKRFTLKTFEEFGKNEKFLRMAKV